MKTNVKTTTSKLIGVLFILITVLFLTSTKTYASTSNEWVWPTTVKSIKNDWPNYSSGSYHAGTDFAAPGGSPVYSTCDGEVVDVKYLTTSYGYHVKIKAVVNNEVVYLRYCHMNSILTKAGDKVRAGEKIGTVGSTGNSTGNHLHFEVRNANDRYGTSTSPNLNPRNYLPGSTLKFKTHSSETPNYCVDRLTSTNARGWIYFKENVSKIVELHFYNEYDGAMKFLGSTKCNKYRPDVAAVYSSCTNYTGFDYSYTLPVGKSTIYIYAITKDGTNPLIYSKSVVTYPKVSAIGHSADIGNLPEVKINQETGIITIGTVGMAKSLQGMYLDLTYNGIPAFMATLHIENIGDVSYINPNKNCLLGTVGKNLQIEGVSIKLSNGLEKKFDLYTRVHRRNIGWECYKKNGIFAGERGKNIAVEAIELKFVAK